MILRFYDSFLRSEFVWGFPCRVKIAILTTLAENLLECFKAAFSFQGSGQLLNLDLSEGMYVQLHSSNPSEVLFII
jgi:hypothetical protein